MGGGNQPKTTPRDASGLTTESRSAALREPVFLVALAVLVLNDRYLKGAALLPGWLTGKLSDFAGLTVAPLLLVVLLGARQRRARALCFAAVSVGFAALEVSPELARQVERLSHAVHVSWRLWPDPTDLLALSMLPVAWHVLHRPRRRGAANWTERLVLVTASLACVATSGDSRSYLSSISLVSRAQRDIELQVFRPATPLDCDAVARDPERLLTPAEFELEACTQLVPFKLFPLDLAEAFAIRVTRLRPHLFATPCCCAPLGWKTPSCFGTTCLSKSSTGPIPPTTTRTW